MTATVQDVCAWMEEWADKNLAESWDNPGLLVGHREQPVRRILTALDATEAVIREAVEKQCDMIVTHHPMIFRPISHVEDGDRTGRRILQLAEHRIALYSAHTNLDAALGGTGDVLAARLGLQDCSPAAAYLRVGYLAQPMSLEELGYKVKEALGLPALRIVPTEETEKKYQKVALCTGAGADQIPLALDEEADVLITGDISYHKAEEAAAAGLALIDAGHFGTEVWIAGAIAEYLNGRAETVEARPSERMRDAFITL